MRWNKSKPLLLCVEHKGLYAFVFEDLGLELEEVLLCDRKAKDAAFSLTQLSEYIKAAGSTSITTALLAHLTSKQAETAGVQEKASHQPAVKY